MNNIIEIFKVNWKNFIEWLLKPDYMHPLMQIEPSGKTNENFNLYMKSLFKWNLLCFVKSFQSGILEAFSNELPNSHFRNDGLTKNWSELFINFLLIV